MTLQAISIACNDPAHTLFPAPKAIVLYISICSKLPDRNLSGFHLLGSSQTFLLMLHAYKLMAICSIHGQLQIKIQSS